MPSSPVMAGRPPSAKQCTFPHGSQNPVRSAILAITSLVVAASPASSLLSLLGETDATLQDWMRRGHPYAFNLGGGQVLKDHQAAADMLLERNLPDIYHDRQNTTVFIPETFLPTVPLAVDTLMEVENQMKRLAPTGKKHLGINPSLPSQVSGDRLEERLYRALKSYPANLGIIIQGACLRTPNSVGLPFVQRLKSGLSRVLPLPLATSLDILGQYMGTTLKLLGPLVVYYGTLGSLLLLVYSGATWAIGPYLKTTWALGPLGRFLGTTLVLLGRYLGIIWKPDRGPHSEQDFLVINPSDKYVLAIECKRSLTHKTISGPSGCVVQLQRVKERVETYLGSKLSPDWRFVGMVYYEEDLAIPRRIICPECSPFTIKGASEVHSKLTAMEGRIRAERPVYSPDLQEYKEMVKTFLFLIFAKPSPTPCRFAADVEEKIVGKGGQGSLGSILFWTMAQAALMLSLDPRYLHVCFLGPWSCGKTLCMREKARQRARDQPGATVNFCVMTYGNFTKMDPLLLLSIRKSMADLPIIRVTSLNVDYSNLSKQLDYLERAMQASPGDWFLDEVTLPEKSDHPAYMTHLARLVASQRSQGKVLWMAVAGVQASKVEPSYLQGLFSPVMYVPGLAIPLRSNMGVIRAAGLDSVSSRGGLAIGRADATVLQSVAETRVQFHLPPHLLEGAPWTKYQMTGRTITSTMARARGELAERMGRRGVAVICTDTFYKSKEMLDIKLGLRQATPLSSPLIYHSNDKSASVREVEEWLERRERGEEERDLVTDVILVKGWEVDAAIVVAWKGFSSAGWENAVMRVTSCGALVQEI